MSGKEHRGLKCVVQQWQIDEYKKNRRQKMRAEDLTKTEVELMSDVEVMYWCKIFAEQEQAAQMRKIMLDQIEIRDANGGRILSIESEVVE